MMMRAWMLAGLIVFSAMATAAEPTFTEPKIPSAAALLDRLVPEHPRLLARADDFASLRKRIGTDPLLKNWHAAIEKEGESLLTAPPVEYEIPDGKRLLAVSRRVVDRIYTLAMLYQLHGEQKYVDRAWQELSAAGNFKDWNPSHFLDTAEMTHAFAIGYDWLYHAWTPQQREAIRTAIAEHGLTPGIKSYRRRSGFGWWVKADHNWNQVCNAGLIAGALAIGDEQPEIAGEILHEGLKSLRRPMHHFAPDGAWAEGPSYWRYAVQYTVLGLAALDTALGTDFGFSEYPGFDRTGDFPLQMTGPRGETFNFADASLRPIRSPEMFWLSRRFDRPAYSRYQIAQAEPTALDLLWYVPASEDIQAPRDHHFRGTDVVLMRSGWGDEEALWLGFKAGSNAVNHSHLDLGSFVLEALGQRWAMDIGADNYNLPGYFGSKRWSYFRTRAESHNTLVINPGEAPDQQPRASAPITYTHSQPCCAKAVADLTDAYAPHAKQVRRAVQMGPDREHVYILDQIDLKQPGEVWWLMHTRASIDVMPDGRAAVLKRRGKELLARIVEPSEARFTVTEAAPLPTSPDPDKQADNSGVRRLTVQLSGVTSTDLIVVLTPIIRPDQATEPAPDIQPLRAW